MATAAATINPRTLAPQTKPAVTIHPTAHLDPGAYVRGTHAIFLDANVLVHPRAQLISIHGPLIIGAGTVVYEKAVLGGPIPIPSAASAPSSSSTASSLGPKPAPGTGTAAAGRNPTTTTDMEDDPRKTVIGSNCSVHPHALIHAGANLLDCVTVESHVTVHANVTVHPHAKVCPGCVVDRDVGEWEVVFGDGRQRRKRAEATDGGIGLEDVEKARLKAMAVERETTAATLKAAARPVIRKK